MSIQNINSEKINLINWITNLQDSSTIERLKEIYLSSTDTISEEHKNIVRDRIKASESNPDLLLDWENVKNEFNL